jgi:hypothetical protein
LKRKNKLVLIKKFNPTSNEKKNYHYPTFVQYKKYLINLFFYRMKNKIKLEKRKKFTDQISLGMAA